METLYQVELSGGPLDGMQCAVPAQAPPFDVYLFDAEGGGWRMKVAYCFACRTTDKGRRWVLSYHSCVARWRLSAEEVEP